MNLVGGPISWISKKQKTIALPMMEAEYMSPAEITKEIVFARNLLKHMKLGSLLQVTDVYCDNESAIELCKNSVYYRSSKHIDINTWLAGNVFFYEFRSLSLERGPRKSTYSVDLRWRVGSISLRWTHVVCCVVCVAKQCFSVFLPTIDFYFVIL